MSNRVRCWQCGMNDQTFVIGGEGRVAVLCQRCGVLGPDANTSYEAKRLWRREHRKAAQAAKEKP